MGFICGKNKSKDFEKLKELYPDKATAYWNYYKGVIPKELLGEETQDMPLDGSLGDLLKKVARPKKTKGNVSKRAIKLVVKNENGLDHYIPGYEVGTNKRAIANRYFRYLNSDGSTDVPMYPFRIVSANGSQLANAKYADMINSQFDRPVVGQSQDKNDAGAIVFTSKVEDAKFIGGEVENMPIDQSDIGDPSQYEDYDEVSQPADFGDLFAEEKNSKKPLFDDKGIFIEEVDLDTNVFELNNEQKNKLKSIDTIISRIQDKLNLIEARIAKSGGNNEMRANVHRWNKEIAFLEAQKNDLIENDVLERVAMNDASRIEENFLNAQDNLNNSNNLSSDQILSIIDSLIVDSYTVKGWIDIQSFVEHSDPDLKQKLFEVSGRYYSLDNQYRDLIASLFVAYANKTSYSNDFSKDSILEAVEDVDFGTTYLLGGGESNIELLKIVKNILDRASTDANQASISKQNEVTNWISKLKNAGFSIKQVNDLFKQRFEGRETGNIIGKISHSYYITRDKILKESQSKKDKSIYTEWINKNANSVTSQDLDNLEKGDESSLLKKGYSKAEIAEQIKLIENYKNDMQANKEYAEIRSDNQEEIDRDTIEWIEENSPFIHLSRGNANGDKYLLREKPKLDLWTDKDFSTIENNKILMEFYDFMKNRFDENNKQLGYFNHFEEFYLPEKEVSTLNSVIKQKGVRKALSQLRTSMWKGISESAFTSYKRHDILGREKRVIPISMMSNKIPASMKVFNVFEILNDHTDMSLTHKYMSEIQGLTEASQDLLDSIKEIKNGKEFKNGLPNAKKSLEAMINAKLYKETKVRGELKIADKTIEVKYIDPDTGKEVVSKEKRQITSSKIIDKLINFTYFRTMGLPNVITPAVNMTLGFNQNMIYASAGEDVTQKNMLKAGIDLATASLRTMGGGQNKDLVNKIFAFMNEFKVIDSIHDSNYGETKNHFEKIAILQEKAEYFNQGTLMLGILYSTKLKDKYGKEINVYDAYKYENGRLVWDVDKMGEMEPVPNNRIIAKNGRGVNFYALSNKVNAINQKVHGDYKNAQLAKKFALVRAFMTFKTWIAKAVQSRFGKERIDPNLDTEEGILGRTVKGRLRSIGVKKGKDNIDILFMETVGMIVKGLVSKKAFNKLDDVDRVNMIRNISEFRSILAFTAMILMIKALSDDDDEPALNLMINTLLRTRADLSFFMSPIAMTQFTQNMIPIVSTLIDAQRIIGYTFDTITGEGTYQSGEFKGSSKILIGTGRMIPGISGGIKMINTSSKVYEQN